MVCVSKVALLKLMGLFYGGIGGKTNDEYFIV